MNISKQASAKVAAIVLISIIFVLSVRTFAAVYMPDMNSDNAIHILMAYDFRVPDDLYYWGQNRLGSVVPMLGNLLLKVLPISPALAVSYVQHSLLLIGFLGFASLFKQSIPKVIFALAWFLPLDNFDALVKIGQPYGSQFAFIGLGVAALNQLIRHPERYLRLKRQVLITSATMSLFISLWISDFSVVFLFLLLLALLCLCYLNRSILIHPHQSDPPPSSFTQYPITRPDGLNILISSSLSILFIIYAKLTATRADKSYLVINTIAQIFEVINRLMNHYLKTLTFQVGDVFLSIHAVLVLILVGYLLYLLVIQKTAVKARLTEWFYLFTASAVLGFMLLTALRWTYDHENLRYYTFVYVMGWLAVLLLVESFSSITAKKTYLLLILIALTSSLSLSPSTYRLANRQPTLQKLAEMQTLGKAGFIGDYWTSYLICSANPALFDCTRYDRNGAKQPRCLPPRQKQRKFGHVRCRRCADKVLQSDNIYLIKDKWLDNFPAEIQQFGQCLIQVGEPQTLASYTLARYQKRSKSQT